MHILIGNKGSERRFKSVKSKNKGSDNMETLNFGWLRRARRVKRLTLGQVASAVGKDRSTIWRMENGKSGISTEMLLKLTQLYGISIADVISIAPDKEN